MNFLLRFLHGIWSVCGRCSFLSHTHIEVVLHIREGENEKSRCVGRLPYDGVAHLGGFRAFLEGHKEQQIIPWPFDFWDSQLSTRITLELEQRNTLEMHDHVVTVIRSHGKQSMAIMEATVVGESSTSDQNEAWPLVSSMSMACAPVSSSSEGEEDLQETSCLKLEPKHKIFLSHSGAQKLFVAQLCKDLEAVNHFSFFDQHPSCLPPGEEFPPLIIDAAKKCRVAVVVLSKTFLSTKWPMLELVEFVRARRFENKNLKLFPLFYKASVNELSDESIQNKWRPRWEKLVGGDTRVDLEEWAAAIRELRGVNGLCFEKFGNSEVSYRADIVKQIFKLSPPDLLYDTSGTFGCKRICEILKGKFLTNTRTSTQVLGLYGMGGLGKTTISKSLCNYFNKDYWGKVCYIEIKEETNALERQLIVMRKLLGLDELYLQRLCSVSEGWELLQSRMKDYQIFLVIDNVQPNGESKEEAQKYLNLKYDLGSKIMVISRSLDVVKDLLGDLRYCCEIPCLTKEEAVKVFLQQGAPLKEYSSLTGDEIKVVENCLNKAWFSHQGPNQFEKPLDQNEVGHYHPLALRAVGSFLHDRSETPNMLLWDNYLSEYENVKDTMKASEHMFNILGLQFNILDRMTQLMFLDICLYASKALDSSMLSNSPLEELIAWLANVHQKSIDVVKSKISDFKRSAMINIMEVESIYNSNVWEVIVHDLYKEFATWFLGQVCSQEEVRGVWCIRKREDLDNSLPHELQCSPRICWPELKRIWLENIWCDGFTVEKIREWCNVVVLQIVRCGNLTTIDLRGLTCLRHLELKYLQSLKTLIFIGDGGSSSISSVHQGAHTKPKQYLLPSLQFVTIDGLSSLECLPTFSPFTSLKFLKIVNCEGLIQPPSVQYCSSLKRMWLSWNWNQKTLPNLKGLTALQDLIIIGDMPFEGRALKLEGLSSLTSLGALELRNIPMRDLSDLESLPRIEYIFLENPYNLACLPQLDNLARSSLHVLTVVGIKHKLEGLDYLKPLITVVGIKHKLEGLDYLKSLIRHKLKGLATQGKIVPYTPTKIKNPWTLPGEYSCTVLQRRVKRKDAKRGDAVLISMESHLQGKKRCGAQLDRGRMDDLFKSLYFNVKHLVDMKAEDLKDNLRKISEGIHYETSDCFVCFVSAHGNTDEHGHYITDESDSKVYMYSDILEPFMTCDALKGIPKVFFINSCQGEYSKKHIRSTESVVEYMKNWKDALVMFSTEEGNESRRSLESGTFFVQILYEEIMQNREKEDVGAIVTTASKILRKNSAECLRYERKKPKCQAVPIHFNLTLKLFWRTRYPSESTADHANNVENIIVGQDVHRETLRLWLLRETKGIEAQSFGILGTGGIGKTMLAKSLYGDEDIKDYYGHRVYWVTVENDPDVVNLQRQLTLEICSEVPSVEINTPKLLLEELKRKLANMRKIFLVLDDVREKKDVDSLLGEPFLEALPPGSKCIITSRKLAELAKLGMTNEQIEKLSVLNDEDARTLFCRKAFSKETLPSVIDHRLRIVVEEVFAACGNLPILLTTIGANRWGIRSVESWEDVRDRLKDITAKNKDTDESAEHQKLMKQLMISCDDLHEWDSDSGDGINLKDYFMDFAVFPAQEKIEILMLMNMWTKPRLTEDEVYTILKELEQRCLVKIDGYLCDVLVIFRAIAVKMVEEPPLKNRKKLFSRGMSNNRLPEEWNTAQNATPEVCEDDLRKELVIFEAELMVIARSELKEFHPRDAILFTCLTRLRMLFLTSNRNLVSLPSAIGYMKSLEKLDLSWCLGLKRLPREIGQLESLEMLNMAGCCSLAEIPAEVGKLKKLVELNMQSCGIVKLPDEIGELTRLTYLCLNDCNQLEALPEAMGKLSSLEKLECDMLEIREIPKALGDLSKLKYLSFGACGGFTEIPAEFVKLKNLVCLWFVNSRNLRVVPDELDKLVTEGSLTVFNVYNTSVRWEDLPPNLHALPRPFDGTIKDDEVDSTADNPDGPYWLHRRGMLVNTSSLYDPSNKEQRRLSFGLVRVVTLAKNEPFLSPWFNMAIQILYTMANHMQMRHAIVRCGGVPVLLRCIDKGDPHGCGDYAAATLANMCVTPSTHKAIVDAPQGLDILTRALHRKNPVSNSAFQALLWIWEGDKIENDWTYSSEILEKCGHTSGHEGCACIWCQHWFQTFLKVKNVF